MVKSLSDVDRKFIGLTLEKHSIDEISWSLSSILNEDRYLRLSLVHKTFGLAIDGLVKLAGSPKAFLSWSFDNGKTWTWGEEPFMTALGVFREVQRQAVSLWCGKNSGINITPVMS